VRNRKEPAFKLLLLAQVLQSFIDGNKNILGEIGASLRVKSFAAKESAELSVMPNKQPVKVSLDIQALFDLTNHLSRIAVREAHVRELYQRPYKKQFND
jgi:hypothetical protein